MSLDVDLILNGRCVFDANITHNLNKMAKAAGIYEALWWPTELPMYLEQVLLDPNNCLSVKAALLIEPIRIGLAKMKADPAMYEVYNAPNGWGLYENFVPWIERYLAACEEYPDAAVRVSR